LKNLYTTKLSYIVLMAIFCLENGFSQVGINTTTPLSTLDINGNLNVKEIGIANALVPGSGPLNGGPFAAKTNINDGVYISLTPTPGAADFQLPNATLVPGRIYILRNISNTQNAFIYSLGGQFFATNTNAATSAPLTMQSNAVTKTMMFISDGANWTYFFF
jgi:hypothetical protein